MKQLFYPLLLLSFFALTGCEDILECTIAGRSPELPNKEFDVGLVNLYYFDEFISEINNEPRDDDYIYDYDIYGDLPDGLTFFTNHRRVTIEGSPQTSGVFEFEVFLYVDPPLYWDDDRQEYDDGMCSTATSKVYTIIIND
ncbi:hypothetical protein [Psychroserpens sp. MEBiC05023]